MDLSRVCNRPEYIGNIMELSYLISTTGEYLNAYKKNIINHVSNAEIVERILDEVNL